MKKWYSILLTVYATAFSACLAEQPWTAFYRKVFTPQERLTNAAQQCICIRQSHTLACTQFIMSWNALRPVRGYFSFWMQVKDACNGQWSSWHHVYDWGAKVQQSYATPSDGIAQFFHVRMEISPAQKANAFIVMVQAHQGATLDSLYAITVNGSDFTHFLSEVGGAGRVSFPSCFVSGVPSLSQFSLDHPEANKLCAPTACCMVLGYLTGSCPCPVSFAQYSFDQGLKQYGSWPFNTAHAFDCSQGTILFTVLRLRSFAHLVALLQRKIPVVVSVRGTLLGAPQEFNQGHLMVVVGYDSATKEVICQDPAASAQGTTIRRYGLKDFLRAWERSHRLAYRADPCAMQDAYEDI